jgi:hypothetical protein
MPEEICKEWIVSVLHYPRHEQAAVAVTCMAGWYEIAGGVVLFVTVQMVGYQLTLSLRLPFHLFTAPMAGMNARTNLLEKHRSMLIETPVGPYERMFGLTEENYITITADCAPSINRVRHCPSSASPVVVGLTELPVLGSA